MSFGDVFGVALVGLCTALALSPVRRPRPLAVVVYMLTLVVTELPHLALLFLLSATVPQLLDDGMPSTLVGWAVLAAAGLTAVGIGVLARRGLAARGVVRRAVVDGLGVWQSRRRRLGDWLHVLLAPFALFHRDVTRVRDLSYGEWGRRNQLDVYHHRSRPANAPVLVYLHGGGYFNGGKRREAMALLLRLASRGWVCVSATYRLRPAAWFPDHLVDAKKALAWTRQHAGEYGGDSRTLVMAGSSAGAHLAALSALTPDDPVFQPGFEAADTRISAAVCLYGYYGRYYGHPPTEAPSSTPLAYDATHAPPFFVAHGANDTYVPVEGARRLVDKLRAESSNPVVYAELPRAQHGFDRFRSVRFEAVIDGIDTFLAEVLEAPARLSRSSQ